MRPIINSIILVLLVTLAAAPTALSQSYKPSAQFESLMNMRYYENNGGFLVEDIQLVFPPASVGKASLMIAGRGGAEVTSVPLRYEKMEFPAFGRLRTASGNPGNVRIGRSGDYVMSLVVDGQIISSMPFALKEENSTDPFNPVKRFVRTGPWSDLAYFNVVPDDPNGEMTFNWWMSTRDIPGGATAAKVTWHLMAGGKEIAASRAPTVPSTHDWYFYSKKQLSVPSQPREHWLTLADIQKLNGEISVVLKANGTPFKTYRVNAAGGQIQRLPENALSHEPHAAFISPRFIDVSSGSNSSYKMYEMYWMRAVR